MIKKLPFLLLVISTLFIFYSCNEDKENIELENSVKGLKKGTEEYNLGLIKILKFKENKEAYIDEETAEKIGFSKEQIIEFKNDILNSNNFYKEGRDIYDATTEEFNPNDLTPEDMLKSLKNQDIQLNNYGTGLLKSSSSQPAISEKLWFDFKSKLVEFIPKANAAPYPFYRVGVNTSGKWIYRQRMIPNIGVKVRMDVPLETSNTYGNLHFSTSDNNGGYTTYTIK